MKKEYLIILSILFGSIIVATARHIWEPLMNLEPN